MQREALQSNLKKANTLLLIPLAVLSAIPAFSQASAHDALARHWKTSGGFTVAVAEKMPADGYTFKPNPEEMTFGQVDGAHRRRGSRKRRRNCITRSLISFCDKAVAAMTPKPRTSSTTFSDPSEADPLRMALGLLHPHGPPSRPGGSLPASKGNQTTGLSFLNQRTHALPCATSKLLLTKLRTG